MFKTSLSFASRVSSLKSARLCFRRLRFGRHSAQLLHEGMNADVRYKRHMHGWLLFWYIPLLYEEARILRFDPRN
jgi:hypothetical protein